MRGVHRPSARFAAAIAAAMPTAVVLSLASAAPAHAHGLVGRTDLPIPEWLFGWGATVVLVVVVRGARRVVAAAAA